MMRHRKECIHGDFQTNPIQFCDLLDEIESLSNEECVCTIPEQSPIWLTWIVVYTRANHHSQHDWGTMIC